MNNGLKAIFFLSAISVYTELGVAATTCQSVKSPQDVLRCAQENHPKVRESVAEVEAANELEEIGSQRPNPNLEGEYIRGTSLGDVILERQIRLSQEIEIGGKRGARMDKGSAQLELAKATKTKTTEDATIETVLVLYRLRQIEEEIHTLDEAQTTYAKAQGQFRKRRTLSPENEVSLNVFELAESENELQKQLLLAEQRRLKGYITLATGLKYDVIANYLPLHKETWPELKEEEKPPTPSSADISIAMAQLKVADSEVELQKAESWPNLTVSPLFKRNSDGGVNYNSFGVGLSLPLPLWHLNGAGRAHAYKKKTLAELSLQNQKTRVERLRATEIATYLGMVSVLQKTRSHLSVEKKHQKIERLFNKGLVSSALVIEAHRQIMDFLKGHHEHEIKALKALWTIYAIDGNVLKKEI